tara:strand:+ start:10347 stop:14690 length:4344 start_codon:yes stop_codon:yes gene_type:complete
MNNIEYTIYEISNGDLSKPSDITNQDLSLLSEVDVKQAFQPYNHFIELTYFTLAGIKLQSFPNYTGFSILSGGTLNDVEGSTEVSFDVKQDYLSRGYEGQEVKALYTFLDYSYSPDSTPQDFYIESISPDRKEVRLVSVNLGKSTVEDKTDELLERYESNTYVPDLHLYFGDNNFITVVNVGKEDFRNTSAVLVKLYQPLATGIPLRTKLNIVERISNSVAYEINTKVVQEKVKVPYLRGANFSVEVDEQSLEPSKYFNYDELFSFPTNNTHRELNSLLNEKGAELGIDYSDFSYYINFSSAEERLRNFKYKVDLIESYQGSLDVINLTSNVYTEAGITGSRVYYEGLLDGIVDNLDHYERHLYYSSGSTSWPKSNSQKPYINKVSSDIEATTWYDGEIVDAVNYDAQNQNLLANTIPAFLREDQTNEPYELFIHMLAQHFDNLWIYTDAVSKKYDTDNRLTRGVSKDLIEDLLKNFGVKLYTSNKSIEDLFKYFTFSNYTSGDEVISNYETANSSDITSEGDYQKEIYKRIYHNLSLLTKSKGTERGLRALVNCFGIPSGTLKIKVYGGRDRNDLPFYGGERPITGSLEKVRLNNTGSIVEGDTHSFYTSILKENNDYTQDLHRIEVGFSPSDNTNDYIVSQSAVLFPNDPFNIDQYIGDPRGYETNRYTDLYVYAQNVLSDVEAYDVNDFVRYIKFFDNVIFRMVRDFVPARTVTDTGIIIKSHLLERNKTFDPTMTWTQPEYTGSIETAFPSGDNAGAFDSSAKLTINGEYVTRYSNRTISPLSGSHRRQVNQFAELGMTTEDQFDKTFEEAKFDGEFANSKIIVTNGELNEDNPYKNLEYPTIEYNVQYYNEIPDNVCIVEAADSVYPVDPDQTINLATAGIFSGVNSLFTYTVDSFPPNGSNPIFHTFTGQQYEQFVVQAEHPDPDITNIVTGEEFCRAERPVMIVQCGIQESNGTPPNPLTINQPYNLWNFFFSDEIINSELTFFINGENIGEVSNGHLNNQNDPASNPVGPENFTFEDVDITSINLEVKDTFDPNNCFKSLLLTMNPCPLANPFAGGGNVNIGGTKNLIPTTNNFSGPEGTGFINSNESWYVFPFGLIGVNSNTAITFQVLSVYENENNPYTDVVTYFSNEVPIDNPLPQSSISTVPTDYADIINTFGVPTEWSGPDNQTVIAAPDGNGLLSPLESDTAQQIFNSPNHPYLFDEGGIYSENSYKRYIRFTATNPPVNGIECTARTNLYLIEGGVYEKRPFTFYYYSEATSGHYNSSPICQITDDYDDQPVTVWARINTVDEDWTALDVLEQGLTIYANASEMDETLAPIGAYGNLHNPEGSPSGWAPGRTARVWNYENPEYINPGNGWDNQSACPEGTSAENCLVQPWLLLEPGIYGIRGLLRCRSLDTDIGIPDIPGQGSPGGGGNETPGPLPGGGSNGTPTPFGSIRR